MLFFQTILVYTLLTVAMCYFANRAFHDNSRYAKIYAWIPLILFTLVFGLRYGVGIDYYNYIDTFEDMQQCDSLAEAFNYFRLEKGFVFITYIGYILGFPNYAFFTLYAFIQILLLYEAFKDEENILPYIYLTFIFTGICMSDFMNIIRNEIAFCIFLVSLRYIRDNEPVKYWIGCIFAYLFHRSAIILFPLYFIWMRKKGVLQKPVIQLCVFFAFIFSSFISQWQDVLHIFDNLIILLGYESYVDIADTMNTNTYFGVTRILNVIVTAVIILNSNTIKQYFKSDLFNIIYDLYFFGICLHYFFLGSMMFQRMIVFFYHTEFIVLAYTLCYFYRTRKQTSTQLLKFALIAFFLLISYSSFIYNCKSNTGAYVSVFQESMHSTKDNLHEQMLQRY